MEAYRSSLTIVERMTGVIMSPSATLREFLKAARPSSAATATSFAELTAIAESSLYSIDEPKEIIVARAEELADIIREDPQHGNP